MGFRVSGACFCNGGAESSFKVPLSSIGSQIKGCLAGLGGRRRAKARVQGFGV